MAGPGQGKKDTDAGGGPGTGLGDHLVALDGVQDKRESRTRC